VCDMLTRSLTPHPPRLSRCRSRSSPPRSPSALPPCSACRWRASPPPSSVSSCGRRRAARCTRQRMAASRHARRLCTTHAPLSARCSCTAPALLLHCSCTVPALLMHCACTAHALRMHALTEVGGYRMSLTTCEHCAYAAGTHRVGRGRDNAPDQRRRAVERGLARQCAHRALPLPAPHRRPVLRLARALAPALLLAVHQAAARAGEP
jgi:hypothetical protein